MDAGGFVDLAALLRFGLIVALAARGRRRRARRRRASRVLETSVVTDACRVRLRVLLGARRSTATHAVVAALPRHLRGIREDFADDDELNLNPPVPCQ